jgi:hypothetical protein
MTIFGVPWDELELDTVRAYLDGAEDEPLLWEAKGTDLDKNEIRRQVCAFANSHEGGYLILGADRPKGAARWDLAGVPFPGEPNTWISDLVVDPERGIRPRPEFDVRSWSTDDGHVAVVRVRPVSTPPCLTNGTVFERLPGKSQVVRDPLRLAELFSRGDAARKGAQARADQAARAVLEDWLEGDAGRFQHPATQSPESDQSDPDKDFVRFAVGVASTGTPPNIAGRLFNHEFAVDVWERQGREGAVSVGAGTVFGGPTDHVYWSQSALTWRHQLSGLAPVASISILRAAWDGSAAAGEKIATEDALPDSLAQSRIAPQWKWADELLGRIGGFGDVYVTVVVTGGSFSRENDGPVFMRRGPLLPGVETQHVASFGRELMRAAGNPEPEPQSNTS